MNRTWQQRGRCAREIPPDFFSMDAEGIRDARTFCSICTVRKQCLVYALTKIDVGSSDKILPQFGVWGARSGKERARIRRFLKNMRGNNG